MMRQNAHICMCAHMSIHTCSGTATTIGRICTREHLACTLTGPSFAHISIHTCSGAATTIGRICTRTHIYKETLDLFLNRLQICAHAHACNSQRNVHIAHTHTRTHMYAHAHTHTHTRTHTHARTWTHTGRRITCSSTCPSFAHMHMLASPSATCT